MVRIRLDPDRTVQGFSQDGKKQLVVVGVVTVVFYCQLVGEPDGEIALVGLARAVDDVAVRGCT